MVAVTAPAVRGWRVAGWVRSWWRRAAAASAGAAGTLLRWLGAVVLACRALAGLLLVSYGAWLAYHPAGFIVPGLLLLVDRVAEELKELTRE